MRYHGIEPFQGRSDAVLCFELHVCLQGFLHGEDGLFPA